MSVLATLVDTAALGKVAAASLIAGIGLTVAFAVAIVGGARFVDMRRDERLVEAAAFGVLGVIGLSISAAAVVFGIVEMLSK